MLLTNVWKVVDLKGGFFFAIVQDVEMNWNVVMGVPGKRLPDEPIRSYDEQDAKDMAYNAMRHILKSERKEHLLPERHSAIWEEQPIPHWVVAHLGQWPKPKAGI